MHSLSPTSIPENSGSTLTQHYFLGRGGDGGRGGWGCLQVGPTLYAAARKVLVSLVIPNGPIHKKKPRPNFSPKTFAQKICNGLVLLQKKSTKIFLNAY